MKPYTDLNGCSLVTENNGFSNQHNSIGKPNLSDSVHSNIGNVKTEPRFSVLSSADLDFKRITSTGIMPSVKMKTLKTTLIVVFVFIFWSPYFFWDLLKVHQQISNRAEHNISPSPIPPSLPPSSSLSPSLNSFLTSDSEEKSKSVQYSGSCPDVKCLMEAERKKDFVREIRGTFKDFISKICDVCVKYTQDPSESSLSEASSSNLMNYPDKSDLSSEKQLSLHPQDFSATNKDHLEIIKKMGITACFTTDGQIQLIHSAATADDVAIGVEGSLFMQEMLRLSKQQINKNNPKQQWLSYISPSPDSSFEFKSGIAQMGSQLRQATGKSAIADTIKACSFLSSDLKSAISGKIEPDSAKTGDISYIVINDVGKTEDTLPMFNLLGDGKDDVAVTFLYHQQGRSMMWFLDSKQIDRDNYNCENIFTEPLLETLLSIVIIITGISTLLYLWFRRKNIQSSNFRSIGKISFDSKQIIGYGSSGTVVYKGYFEQSQQIAVKRVIIDYFTLAEREIELLRTFQHQNLIRYFATESDDIFKYIGIELANFSLAEHIEGLIENVGDLDPIDILYQSSLGLEHLHSLNIVHRDIKPQNILISMPLQPTKKRKIMISDFGVSKQIASTTSMSGDYLETTHIVRGTVGWIAPEVIQTKLDKSANSSIKFAKPVDIFSFGCLFYYVLTNGKHPFGESVERQANILKGCFNLENLPDEENLLKTNIIESMIALKAIERPSIEAILKHPLFWTPARQLAFFQDVSDRLEKAATDSDVVKSLEKGGFDVVKGDWRRHITEELQQDLTKFRSYRGSSVRDLMRGLRNKKHHYNELNPSLRKSLGSIPDEFVYYFTSRFPRLLIHSYIAMQAFRDEHIFKDYYDSNSYFPPLPRTWKRYFESSKPKNGKILPSDDEVGPIGENGSLYKNSFSAGEIIASDINDNNPVECDNWRASKPNAGADLNARFFTDLKSKDKLTEKPIEVATATLTNLNA